MNITGSNDAATITASGSEDNSVVEAGGVANAAAGDEMASGKLTVHDVDGGESQFAAVPAASLSGAYGDFTFNSSTGAWTFTLDQGKADALTAGQQVTQTLVVQSLDGTANQAITVNITGTNDAAVITGDSTAELTETDAVLSTGGTLPATTWTTRTTLSRPARRPASRQLQHRYGRRWTYTIDSAFNGSQGSAASLGKQHGEQRGRHASRVTVTMTGTNDAAR